MKVTQLFNKYWLLIILILQPILDIIAYFNFKTNITPITFVLRSAILLFTIVYTFIKSKNKKNFILCMLPIAVFSLLHLGNSYRVGMLSFFSDLRYLIFVIQLPILTICFIDYIKWNKECLKLLKSAFVINTLLIFFSLILAIWSGDFAYTYYNYGLTGWFSSANTQSMILVAITPLFLYFSTRNKNVILYILNHAIVFFLLFLNGTKACYIALLIIYIAMIYISLVSEKGKLRIYKTLVSVMSLSLVLFFGNDSATFKRLDDVNDVSYKNEVTIKEKIKEKIDKLDKPSNIEEDNPSEEDIEYNIYDLENYSDDIIIDILNDSYIWEDIISIHGGEKVLNKIRDDLTPAALSDNRLRKRVNASIYFDESDIFTKMVGFEYTKVSDFDLENDLTAIFYYYGYLGFGLYSLFILYFGWLLFKMFWRDKKIIFDGEFVIYGITLVLLIFGGEYSGAFLRKSNANIYLSCLLALIYFKYYKNLFISSENIKLNLFKYFNKLYKKGKDKLDKQIIDNLKAKKKMFIITANPETFMYGENNKEFNDLLLDKNSILIPDGIGIVKASQILGYDIKERITGIDLANQLLKICNKEKYKLCLLGAKENVMASLKKVIKENYPNIKLGTCENGYVENKDAFFEKIKKENPDVCLVALGIPNQELLIYKHLEKFKKGIFVGVGGSFDVISGTKKRAPKIFQKLNLEWLYRIVKEPKRFKRFYNNNVKFIIKIKRINSEKSGTYEKN